MKLLDRGDKLDKYRDHLLQDGKLNADQAEMLGKYRRASALMCQGYSKMQAMTFLTKEFDLSVPQAYAIIRDSVQLFGDVNKVDKEGMRYIMYENFMLAATLARKREDYNAMIRAQERAAQIYDLFTVSEEFVDPTQFLRPAKIVFTSDPQFFVDSQKAQAAEYSDAEDVDYEETE